MRAQGHSVLIAAHDEEITLQAQGELESRGCQVNSVATLETLRDSLSTASPAFVLMDVDFEGDGLAVFQELCEQHFDLPVVFVANRNCVETAVRAMKLGARDYFTAPLRPGRLHELFEQVSEPRAASRRFRSPKYESKHQVNGRASGTEVDEQKEDIRPPDVDDVDLDGITPADDKGFPSLEELERQAILQALDRTNGHVVRAAKMLGLGQATVYRKIKQYGITRTPSA